MSRQAFILRLASYLVFILHYLKYIYSSLLIFEQPILVSATYVVMSSHEPKDSARCSRSPHSRHRYERSRSPRPHHHHHGSRKRKRSKPSAPVPLPFKASKLHRDDFEAFKPMFELYLDIQKQKVLGDLPLSEVKGRWKSFVGRWYTFTFSIWPGLTMSATCKRLTFVRNRGELAEGWYDPATLQKAQASAASNAAVSESQRRPRASPSYGSPGRTEESSDEDSVGPSMPGGDIKHYKSGKKPGPAIPNLQDLELRKGMAPGIRSHFN